MHAGLYAGAELAGRRGARLRAKVEGRVLAPGAGRLQSGLAEPRPRGVAGRLLRPYVVRLVERSQKLRAGILLEAATAVTAGDCERAGCCAGEHILAGLRLRP